MGRLVGHSGTVGQIQSVSFDERAGGHQVCLLQWEGPLKYVCALYSSLETERTNEFIISLVCISV